MFVSVGMKVLRFVEQNPSALAVLTVVNRMFPILFSYVDNRSWISFSTFILLLS